jgi:hypothetical protein
VSRAAYFREWHARNPQYRHDWQLRARVTQGKWAFVFGIRVRVNLVQGVCDRFGAAQALFK